MQIFYQITYMYIMSVIILCHIISYYCTLYRVSFLSLYSYYILLPTLFLYIIECIIFMCQNRLQRRLRETWNKNQIWFRFHIEYLFDFLTRRKIEQSQIWKIVSCDHWISLSHLYLFSVPLAISYQLSSELSVPYLVNETVTLAKVPRNGTTMDLFL